MKPKNYRKLLDLIMEFANEHDIVKQHRLIDTIWGDAFMLGFWFRVKGQGEKDVSSDVAVGQYQAALLENLEETADTRILNTFHSCHINCSEKSGDGIRMIFRGDNPDNLFRLLAMIMFIQGFKGVRRCPGCNKLFVIKKHTAQKACSNRCRQRLFQAAKSDDKKEAEKKKRIAEYKDKILNGGGK